MKRIHAIAQSVLPPDAETLSPPAPRQCSPDYAAAGASSTADAIGAAGADRLLGWVARRWPGQWLRGLPAEEAVEIANQWSAEAAVLTAEQARRACSAWRSKAYPPDLGAFLAAAEPPQPDAETLFRHAAQAAGTRAYHMLSPLEWAAAQRFGLHELRAATWASASLRWTAALRWLAPAAERGELPPPPPQPAGELPRPRRPEVIEQELGKIRGLLRRTGGG